MSKEQPSYYAIVPAHVRYDKRLTPNMKLMYGELTALSNKYGSCWATNKYFGELYDVSHKTAGEWINSLARCGHIFVSVDKERGNRRSITLPEAKRAKIDSYPEKDGEGYPDKDDAENENLPYMPESNNTSVNNTSRISNTAPTDQNRSVPKPVTYSFTTGLFSGVSDEMVATWQAMCPAINVDREIIKAAQWLLANPTKRKKNYRKFLVNWILRSQERGKG